ncbi:MAG: hypothetical protein ACOC44_04635 [Promethearchaeia archaeon]
MLDWNFWINLICSIGGVTFFIISLLIIKKIKALFPGANVIKKWVIIQSLIILFLFGYLFNIIFLAIDAMNLVNIMTAIVYIFGALFVLIVVNLSYKTYKVIIEEG